MFRQEKPIFFILFIFSSLELIGYSNICIMLLKFIFHYNVSGQSLFCLHAREFSYAAWRARNPYVRIVQNLNFQMDE